MSCQATFYRQGAGRPSRVRDGEVYYWPPSHKKCGPQPPLRLRLIRAGAGRRHDVWLATNVLDRRRLSVAQASRLYRWRWENEGLFRTFKRTLAKVKLHSRTVRLVHREAEGAMLATQLLRARACALRPGGVRGGGDGGAARSQVLLAIRDELRARGRGRGGFAAWRRPGGAAREPSAKVKRIGRADAAQAAETTGVSSRWGKRK